MLLGDKMDNLYESAYTFLSLLDVQYHFVLSKKRKTVELTLDFQNTDYYHLVGLQYLDDLRIERDREKTMQLVFDGDISESILKQSRHYTGVLNKQKDVRTRIERLCYLGDYLDTNNTIKFFSIQHSSEFGSSIEAEYFIKSQLPHDNRAVYIFIRKRKENNKYCIVSFFQDDGGTYNGEAVYWMLKEKMCKDGTVELFRSKNYTTASKDSCLALV